MKKEHPIIFSGEMVRAILDGRKSQTRRVVKLAKFHADYGKPRLDEAWVDHSHDGYGGACLKVPYSGGEMGETTQRYFPPWVVGDTLWCKETFLVRNDGKSAVYRAYMGSVEAAGFGAMYGGWKPSIYMPRWASRITLEVTGVRVERLQEITWLSIVGEGCSSVGEWICLWDGINGRKHPWSSNPWVWALEFRRVTA